MRDPDTGDPRLEEPDEAGATLVFAAGAAEAGARLDAATAALAKAHGAELSRTRLQALIAAGCLTVDGAVVCDGKRKLRAGETVAVAVPPAIDAEPRGEAIPLAVVYEDADLVVIDKPAGLVVHPAPGHAGGTLVNALIAHCGDSLSGIGGVKRPGIVHRIDKDTSGLLVVAKTDAAHRGLAATFADHGRTMALERSYLAFVWGEPPRPHGIVEAPLGRHRSDRLRMAVVPLEHGREALTHWRVMERYGADGPHAAASLLACALETGRTHQIRVHMDHIGHPLLGDPLYGKGFRTKAGKLAAEARAAVEGLGRQALHAAKLGFPHPVTGRQLRFESPLPPDLQQLADALGAKPHADGT